MERMLKLLNVRAHNSNTDDDVIKLVVRVLRVMKEQDALDDRMTVWARAYDVGFQWHPNDHLSCEVYLGRGNSEPAMAIYINNWNKLAEYRYSKDEVAEFVAQLKLLLPAVATTPPDTCNLTADQ